MAQDQKKSTAGLKFLFASISLAGILGLWSAFTSKAQLAAVEVNGDVNTVQAGEIFLPEMPTLVAVIDLPNPVMQLQPQSEQQNLRNVSVPTPQVGQTPPAIVIQQIIVENSSAAGSSSSGSSSSSSAASPSTSTGSSS